MSVNSSNPTRRAALGTAALGALAYRRLLGANDRVQVGFIGYGLIGAQHVSISRIRRTPILRPCAMSTSLAWNRAWRRAGGGAKPYSDFRRMLDNKDLQAVVVCTPDHWHALMTMMACAAGKDVYVEKPLTVFVKEGRWMTTVARRHNRVVQVGTQQRSGLHYQRARQLLQAGYIGKIMNIRGGLATGISCRASARRPMARRRAISITICGSGRRRRGPTIRSAGSIISAGSGITRAAR